MTTRVYLASKLYMAEAWREFRSQQIDIEFTSSWIDNIEVELRGEATPQIYEDAWERNVLDVKRADAVLAYADRDDILCGGLVEIGIAIGLDKTVVCVGSSKSFGTWEHHPNVYRAKTCLEALNLIRKLL